MYPTTNSEQSENYNPYGLADCIFFTKLGYNWEKAMKCTPSEVRGISIRTGIVHVTAYRLSSGVNTTTQL